MTYFLVLMNKVTADCKTTRERPCHSRMRRGKRG
jgi:hypothetical protein